MANLSKTKLEKDLEKSKKATANRNAKAKSARQQGAALLGGGLGTLGSAIGCAAVDAKMADEADVATLGKTPIPVNAAAGAVLAGVGFWLAKKNPGTGSFFYHGGMTAVGISLYSASRNKMEEWEDEREAAA